MIADGLLTRLEMFISEDLASQLPMPADDIHGTIVPCFDEERYCGPNSAVKDVYRLELSFQAGAEVIGNFRDDISYDTASHPAKVGKARLGKGSKAICRAIGGCQRPPGVALRVAFGKLYRSAPFPLAVA